LTALIEIGIILIADGDKYSKIHNILSDRKQTIGLVLILIGFGLVPILNIVIAFVLAIMWGEGEL
jgi:hypothetical protein